MTKETDPERIPCLFCGRRMISRCADEETARDLCAWKLRQIAQAEQSN